MTTVSFNDLWLAYQWVSVDHADTEAYVSLERGKIYYVPLEDEAFELLEDFGNESKYLRIPNRHELGLGRDMVFQFAKEVMSKELEEVYVFFRYRGAYRRFKEFLIERGKLEVWYEFESKTTEEALRKWCTESDLLIKP